MEGVLYNALFKWLSQLSAYTEIFKVSSLERRYRIFIMAFDPGGLNNSLLFSSDFLLVSV
jgi:hypothetical protein